MTHDQVQAAVHGALSVAVSQGTSGSEGRAEFWLERRTDARFSGPAVTTYYDGSIGLAGIAIVGAQVIPVRREVARCEWTHRVRDRRDR
jgi:hypothetical protein